MPVKERRTNGEISADMKESQLSYWRGLCDALEGAKKTRDQYYRDKNRPARDEWSERVEMVKSLITVAEAGLFE